MSADFPSVLEERYVLDEHPTTLLDSIKRWILSTKPVSTRHPYGFWVVLLRRVGDEEWRFHLWARRREPSQGMLAPIHTHDKLVESRILKGELENIIYSTKRVITGGLPTYEARHLSDKYSATNKNLLIKHIDRYVPYIVTRQTLRAGESYRVPAHVFHEAKVPDELITCTLVRVYSQIPGAVRILGTDGYPSEIEFRRFSAPAAEVIVGAEI